MSKRPRNAKQSEEVPRIEKFAISDEITLRIRYSDSNVDGSVMMFYKDKVYECHHLKEARATEFTEPNWMTRYRKINGEDDGTDEEIKKYNEEAKLFCNRMSIRSITNSCLTGPNAITNVRRFSSVSLDENNILTLKMEIDEPSDEATIENTEHVSMRLRFIEIN